MIAYVDKACHHYLDEKREDLIGVNLTSFIPEEGQARVREHFASLLPPFLADTDPATD